VPTIIVSALLLLLLLLLLLNHLACLHLLAGSGLPPTDQAVTA
jgi:hypothetical protein